MEGEIKRLSPDGGFLSLGTLSIAASNVNSRIRNTGLSAKEIIMKRDAITNEPIHIDDNKLQDFKYEKRIQNHGYSEKSKSNGNPSAVKAIVPNAAFWRFLPSIESSQWDDVSAILIL